MAFAYKDLLTYQNMNLLIHSDGTVALTANWDAGNFEIRARTFESDVAGGTAPLVVASTTKVTNLNTHYVDFGGTPTPVGNSGFEIPVSNATLCSGLNADRLDGNHASAFSILTYDGGQEFTGNAPVAYTDLDLSGTIGSNRAMVYLKIKSTDVAGNSYEFRTDDDADVTALIGGCCACSGLTQNEAGYVWVMTDATGVIEWKGLANTATNIDLLVYLKVV